MDKTSFNFARATKNTANAVRLDFFLNKAHDGVVALLCA